MDEKTAAEFVASGLAEYAEPIADVAPAEPPVAYETMPSSYATRTLARRGATGCLTRFIREDAQLG